MKRRYLHYLVLVVGLICIELVPTRLLSQAHPDSSDSREPTLEQFIAGLKIENDLQKVEIVSLRESEVIIKHNGHYQRLKFSEVPSNIEAKVKEARTAQEEKDERSYKDAMKRGLIREVEGEVYDLRKPQAGWASFSNARVLQVLDNGYLMVDETRSTTYKPYIILVRKTGFGKFLADGDRLSFQAKDVGTFSYETKGRDDKTVHIYDIGVAYDGKPRSAVAEAPSSERSPLPSKVKGNGSGFFITEDGYFITNFHVVERAKKLEIRTPDAVYSADVVATSEDDDLAVLKAKGRFHPLPIADYQPKLGSAVFTIGYPLVAMTGLKPKFTDGKISSLAGLHDDPSNFQISVPIQPGNSGGPLVDTKSGAVVGVVVSKLSDLSTLVESGTIPQNVNYAVKSERIRALLTKRLVDVAQQLSKAGQRNSGPKSEDEAISTAEQAVGMVLIY
jgi:S1-C subfamily serine protease